MTDNTSYEYVGFWLRVTAVIVDSIILMAIFTPLLVVHYGMEAILSGAPQSDPMYHVTYNGLGAILVIVMWKYFAATPGKMLLGAKIVDARTGGAMTTGQCIGRYLAYIPSMLGLFLGFLWIAFDARKQGWHDKLAKTVVIREKTFGPGNVRFEQTE